MLGEEETHSIAAIRKLLIAAFAAEELRRFCQDRPLFLPIVDRFGPNHGLDDMVDEVITYCQKRSLFDQLLDEVRRCNPAQYDRHGPYRYEARQKAHPSTMLPTSPPLIPPPRHLPAWFWLAAAAVLLIVILGIALPSLRSSGRSAKTTPEATERAVVFASPTPSPRTHQRGRPDVW